MNHPESKELKSCILDGATDGISDGELLGILVGLALLVIDGSKDGYICGGFRVGYDTGCLLG